MEAHNGLLRRVKAKVEIDQEKRGKEKEKVPETSSDSLSAPSQLQELPEHAMSEDQDQEEVVIESGDDTATGNMSVPTLSSSSTSKDVVSQNPEDWTDEELQRRIDKLHLERQELYALFRKSVAEGAQSTGIITLDDDDEETGMMIEGVEDGVKGRALRESLTTDASFGNSEDQGLHGLDREEGEVPP